MALVAHVVGLGARFSRQLEFAILPLRFWLFVGDLEGPRHTVIYNFAEPHIWILYAMKWIWYAVNT